MSKNISFYELYKESTVSNVHTQYTYIVYVHCTHNIL